MSQEKEATPLCPEPNFEIIFTHVQRMSSVVAEVQEISRQAENIRMIVQAVNEVDAPRLVTFVTA
jgi:hypothetical protein